MAYDYNPDKEKHRDHKWIVSKATTDPTYKSVQTEKGNLKFDREGRFAVSDPGLANEIMQNTSAADAVVTRVNAVTPSDRGHTYFFGGWPEMPWKRKEREDAEQKETQGSESDQSDGQETQQEEAAQPAPVHPIDVESWAFAGGMAVQNTTEEPKFE